MTLKVKYWLYLGVIHSLLFALVYLLLEENKWYVLLSELGIILLLWLGYRLFLAFLQPVQRMVQGADTIEDQDFHHTFSQTTSPEMNRLIKVYNGMIGHIREERIQIAEQHFFLDKLIEASPSGIILLDFDNHLTLLNPSAKRWLKLSDSALGKSVEELEHPILNKINQLEVGESSIVSAQGIEQYRCHMVDFIHRGFHRKFFLMEELSKELLATEKRAYGKVIRMMAHEVNNSIGAVNSILDSVRDMHQEAVPPQAEEVVPFLDLSINRNKRLTKFMQNFASVIRLPEPHKELIDLHHLVQQVTALMAPQAKDREIDIDLNFAPAKVQAMLDLNQMEQVLVNVLKNSMEAIDQQGIIRVQTTEQPVSISISDNGQGIPKEVALDLFSPFFSTKKTGQGVGLTLVREILLNHDVHFSLETKANGWTVFEMRL
ncbi:MAG: ATP-binding protein [Bacteroidota bacterium]